MQHAAYERNTTTQQSSRKSRKYEIFMAAHRSIVWMWPVPGFRDQRWGDTESICFDVAAFQTCHMLNQECRFMPWQNVIISIHRCVMVSVSFRSLFWFSGQQLYSFVSALFQQEQPPVVFSALKLDDTFLVLSKSQIFPMGARVDQNRVKKAGDIGLKHESTSKLKLLRFCQ